MDIAVIAVDPTILVSNAKIEYGTVRVAAPEV